MGSAGELAGVLKEERRCVFVGGSVGEEELTQAYNRVPLDWIITSLLCFDQHFDQGEQEGCSLEERSSPRRNPPQLLQETVAVPVWEIIVVRMSVTWLACYLCASFERTVKEATDEATPRHALGQGGASLLRSTRRTVAALHSRSRRIRRSIRHLLFSQVPVALGRHRLDIPRPRPRRFVPSPRFSPSSAHSQPPGFLASVFLHEPYSRAEALTGFASLGGVVLIAKPSFLFPASTRDVVLGPGGIPVTSEQRTLAVGVAMIGVFGAAGAYLCIRKIGKRANA